MHPKLRILKNVKNPLIKDLYDGNKLPVDNLIALGLETNANGLGQPRYTRHPEDKEPENAYPGFVGYVESLPPSSNKPKNVLTELEMLYAESNMKNHGDNYKAMERDMKTNPNQYTEAQMRKLIERYQKQCLNHED